MLIFRGWLSLALSISTLTQHVFCHKALQHRQDASAANSAPSSPTYSTEDLYNMSRQFMDSFIFPKNQQQAQSINSTIFSEDVLGRVDATRTFVGRELNTEYIYGLFASLVNNSNSAFFSLLGEPTRYDLSHWAGAGNVVSYGVIAYLAQGGTNTTVPFEIDVWLTYDGNRQISQYDVTFRYLQWAFDSQAKASMQALNISNPVQYQQAIQQKLAASICSIAQGSCNGTNQQYDSMDDCMNFLTQQVRFGQTYEMGMNTVLCRMVHQNMVPLRPDVHCSHIGKSGGAYCVDDRAYDQAVTEKFFKNSDFVAMGFPGQGDE